MRTWLILFFSSIVFFCACKKSGTPPGPPTPVTITSVEKDDVSNTIHWSRSEAPDFKAYEVYWWRTDYGPDRGPYPEGNLITRITDRDVVSLRHDSIYFYYRYSYMVKVVTESDSTANSNRMEITSGTFLELGEGASTQFNIFDPKRQRMYLSSGKLKIFDPLEMKMEDSVQTMDAEAGWFSMNSSGNNIDYIFKTSYHTYKTASIDIDSRTFTQSDQEFWLPTEWIMYVMDKYAIYTDNIRTTSPFISLLVAYNTETGTSDTLRYNGNTGAVRPISNNRLVASDYSDSFFVYQLNAGKFELIKEGITSGLSQNVLNVYESNTFVAFGNKIFDQSFNEQFEIEYGNRQNRFIGISSDGKYAVTSENEIINTSTQQIEKVYGDGFGSSVYFSDDNDYLFHFTETRLNARWQPPSKLFRYPWR